MKVLWFGATLLVILSLMAGCGVAQEKYDAVIADRDAANTQVTSLQSDLEEAQRQNETLQDELSAAQAKYSDLESEYEALKQEATKLKRLTLFTIAFCSEKPEAPKYKAKADNTYKTNEVVYLYGEIIGFKYKVINGELEYHLEATLRVINSEGKVIHTATETFRETTERPFAYVWHWRKWKDLKAGDYTMEVTVTDKISGETASWEGEFRVIE